MKAGKIKIAVLAASLALLVPAAANASELQDKIVYCKSCHGTHGQGTLGYYTMPRLAGQQIQYIENVFKALEGHSRDNPVAKKFMVPAEGSIPVGMQTALAKYFNGLDARPSADGPRDQVAQGKKIYEEGVPGANVPACAACHGPEAKGVEATPRLAGQHYTYLVAQLLGWKKGYRGKDPVTPDAPNTMQPIAAALSKEQASAVAAYLSYAQ